MGKVSSLYLLNNEELLVALYEAKRLELGSDFFQFLMEEAMKRNLLLKRPVTHIPTPYYTLN